MSLGMRNIIYREIAEARGPSSSEFSDLPSLRAAVAEFPQEHEEKIVAYLKNAPNYSAMGKVVHDALDPESRAVLFPGSNTDGVYIWPIELAYYVRKYHIRLPQDFLDWMASRSWKPSAVKEIDYKTLNIRDAKFWSDREQSWIERAKK